MSWNSWRIYENDVLSLFFFSQGLGIRAIEHAASGLSGISRLRDSVLRCHNAPYKMTQLSSQLRSSSDVCAIYTKLNVVRSAA